MLPLVIFLSSILLMLCIISHVIVMFCHYEILGTCGVNIGCVGFSLWGNLFSQLKVIVTRGHLHSS